VAGLSADTDLAPIRKLGEFGDAEGARLEEVQRPNQGVAIEIAR
jgi:hypothetical protein